MINKLSTRFPTPQADSAICQSKRGRLEKGLAKPSALPGFGSGRTRFTFQTWPAFFGSLSGLKRHGLGRGSGKSLCTVVASSDQAFRYTDLERVRAAASALAAISVGPAFRQFPLRADSSVVKNTVAEWWSCPDIPLQDTDRTLWTERCVRPKFGYAPAGCQGRRVTRATGSGGPGWRLRRIELRQGRKMGWTVQPIFFWFSGLRCKSHH
ncbi:hypothetical protein FHW18_003972 [Pigmentiphaga litoralis]|uniref:Uncharacterized protein n=1 Tax=Pigmentiphaga litoralis TaxID=516702 RepID=A0A7Y9IX45_9BURK|nr:hypothetical protein [Pigmentiphaga litoralis]NYE84701.1 hypothetical protein [Pigmentiphaga litoralis]